MGKYIMTTGGKEKFVLTENEAEAIKRSVRNGDAFTVIKGEMVSLQIVPSVIRLERWYAQENERLALTHHRLCKKCLSVMQIADKCPCWKESGKSENKHAFVAPELPDSVKESVRKVSSGMGFPGLSDGEKAEVEAEDLAMDKRLTMPAPGGGFIDKDTGEVHYQ